MIAAAYLNSFTELVQVLYINCVDKKYRYILNAKIYSWLERNSFIQKSKLL